MGKKGRRPRHKAQNSALTNGNPTSMHQSMHQSMRQTSQNLLRKGDMEVFAKMAQLDFMPFDEQKATIRKALVSMGTNCDLNDTDLTGNGDQSNIQTEAQREAARELFAMGGDMAIHLREHKLPPFVLLCVTGQVEEVRVMLEEARAEQPPPWSQCLPLKVLLDTRVTSLRMSPLLLMVSLGMKLVLPGVEEEKPSPLLSVAKLLLEYGATPNVQDVLGKTVCHYGAGAMASGMSMDLADMCIEASKTVHLYGKEVELKGMDDSNEDLTTLENGMTGIVGGYRYDSAERSVYLVEQKRQIWIKPKHLRLVVENNGSTENKGVKLVDVQDRMGATSLTEVILQDRVDVATFLLKKHRASIHVMDMDGMTPLKMSSGPGGMMSSVCKMVSEVNLGEAGERRKAKRDRQLKCAQCLKKLGTNALQCSKCKTVSYCGRDCQRAHWDAGHKKECSIIANANRGVRLDPPKDTGMHMRMFSTNFSETRPQGTYRKPTGVAFNELFVLKIQANTHVSPILIYDETRTCQFNLNPGEPGFQEVLIETQKEKAWDGRKTFMRASFDESGYCTIFPHTAQVKTKYNW